MTPTPRLSLFFHRLFLLISTLGLTGSLLAGCAASQPQSRHAQPPACLKQDTGLQLLCEIRRDL